MPNAPPIPEEALIANHALQNSEMHRRPIAIREEPLQAMQSQQTGHNAQVQSQTAT